MAVGVYIRVSTEDQVSDGYSISAQRERLKAFCIAQGWDNFKFYVDEGISGKSTKRPQFQKLMNDIKDEKINVLLVYRLDRLTRSVRDLHNTLDYLDKYNCTFRSATEIYDTATAMGRMFITIVAAIAEWESANLGERVKMGQIEKARQGEWAAQAPYGFYKDKGHKLHIHEHEIKAVKLMMQKIREGLSFRQLSIYMDASDYKPKRGYKWHIRTLMDIMHNPVLYGAMRWKEKIYENTHEGIMTKQEFDKLQKLISSRQNQKKRDISSAFIYQTKIVCPDCSSRCTSERFSWTRKTDGETKVSNSYRCQVCALNHRGITPFRARETMITDALLKYMEHVSVAAPAIKKEVVDNPIDDVKKEMKRIETQREKYQRAWASDLITDEEFKDRMNDTRLRYDELQGQLERLDEPVMDDDGLKELKKTALQFKDNFTLLNETEKRAFIQMFFERIEINVLEKTKSRGHRNQRIEVTGVTLY